MGVAAVLSGAGSEVKIWTTHLSDGVDRSIRGIVVFTIIPLFLIWLNSRGVKVSNGPVKINLRAMKLSQFVYLSCTVGLK
jgi:hypothetical protein